MRGVIHRRAARKAEIDGSFATSPAENFRPELFGRVAREVWGQKADVIIAGIAGYSDRAARDVLRGLVGAPGTVLAAMFVEIARRPPRRKRQRVRRLRLVRQS